MAAFSTAARSDIYSLGMISVGGARACIAVAVAMRARPEGDIGDELVSRGEIAAKVRNCIRGNCGLFGRFMFTCYVCGKKCWGRRGQRVGGNTDHSE